MSTSTTSHISPGRRVATRAFIVAGVAALGWWVVSVNRISVQTSLPGDSRSFVVELPNPEPLVVTISPSRRVDGTEVFIDGRSVAHPPGDEPGQILVNLDRLEPGIHAIEIRIPRPTWTSESFEIEVEILRNSVGP